ncbi:MAG: molecular chaperone TorD family protein [Acidobacteriota bacterium]
MPGESTTASGGVDDPTRQVRLLLGEREGAYDVLKCVFLEEPSLTLLRLLAETDLVVFTSTPAPPKHRRPEAGADTGAAFCGALAAVRQSLERPDVLSDEHRQRLRWDYTRMFIGPGRVPAPPWESLYRDVERLHFSTETLEVRAAYQKYGLLPAGFGREPDDHVGFELDFMRRLCALAGERAGGADMAGVLAILEDQRAFLDDHLLRWIPEWAADVVTHAETDFYRNMARLLSSFVVFDRRTIDAQIGMASSLAPRGPAGPKGPAPPTPSPGGPAGPEGPASNSPSPGEPPAVVAAGGRGFSPGGSALRKRDPAVDAKASRPGQRPTRRS